MKELIYNTPEGLSVFIGIVLGIVLFYIIYKVTMNTNKISIQEFYEMLRHHDWWYEYSDDHRVWQRGRKQQEKIELIASKHTDFMEIYLAYKKYVFNSVLDSPPVMPSRKKYVTL